MTVRRLLMNLAPTFFLAALVANADHVKAQGSEDASNRAQDSRSGDGSGGAGHKAQIAEVGAGTTNASTTGHSGPQDFAGGTPGTLEPPPLPSPRLCDSYIDTPAYQTCLSVVLRD
jgi:hypothetical protein